MDITKEKTLTIKLVGKEVDDFITPIGSLKKEVTKVGFNSNFLSESEFKILTEIHNQINK